MDNNINEIIQYTLVAIIVALAIIWLLKKIFTTKKNKTKTLCNSCPHASSCSKIKHHNSSDCCE